MYCTRNFQTKKELKEALKSGAKLTISNPGFGSPPVNGRVSLEGPHFPLPHKWYADAEIKDGLIISVK